MPQHLPATLKVKAVRLMAGQDDGPDSANAFDAVWNTPALPETDYCAGLKGKFGNKGGMGG